MIKKIKENKISDAVTAFNPFTPSFGNLPPILVGREVVLENIKHGLSSDSSDPFRTMLFTGTRGTGKTVMLEEIARFAERLGYVCINVTAGKPMKKDILDQLKKKTLSTEALSKRRIKSISVGQIGFSLEEAEKSDLGFRTVIENAIEELDKRKRGVLFTIDEIYKTADGLEELVTSYQHYVRQKKNVAMFLAGLPKNISDILSDSPANKNLTFLRRAERCVLGNVPLLEVKKSYKETISKNGKKVSDSLAEEMAGATEGFPFMVQLVGYHTFRSSGRRAKITKNDVSVGIFEADRRLDVMVFEPSFGDLSDVDREVLHLMADEETPVSTSVLAKKLNVSNAYLQQYRSRLIAYGLIHAPKRGLLDFSVAGLKEYIKNSSSP
jgi:hypothetical protein